jgi:eukaryotic-like serine/threonine-protein kinase
MAASPIRVGEVLADKYRVEEILGQGGMGIVVAAWHLELEQRVAVKFLLPEYAENKEAAERFRREARAAVKIQSEHVARVVDVGTMTGGIPYMVMEFLNGHDLASELERSGKFPIDAAVDCVFQTCLAMAEAHSRGVIHRDLKPANLFLTSRADGSRLVKVLDFGISKSIQSDSMPQLALTRTSIMVGSPLYMSPEQLESSKQADERSDIWSLGVILFELLTGTLPFTGETLPQLVRSVLTGKYPRVRDLRADVPERLSHVIDRCLESDKSKRIRNVADLADALAPFQSDGYRYSERIRKVLTISNAAKMDAKTRVTGDIPAQTSSMREEDLPDASGPPTDVSAAEPAPSTGIPVYEDSERPPAAESTTTANSWGRTGARAPSGRPGPRAWPWAAAAFGVLALGGLWIWSRGLGADARAVELAGDVEAPSTAATPAAAPPIRITPSDDTMGKTNSPMSDVPVRAEAPPAASSGDPSLAEAASSTDVSGIALGDGVKPGAPQGPPGVKPPIGKPHGGKKAGSQPAPKPAAAPSTNKPDNYTDFGGRR